MVGNVRTGKRDASHPAVRRRAGPTGSNRFPRDGCLSFAHVTLPVRLPGRGAFDVGIRVCTSRGAQRGGGGRERAGALGSHLRALGSGSPFRGAAPGTCPPCVALGVRSSQLGRGRGRLCSSENRRAPAAPGGLAACTGFPRETRGSAGPGSRPSSRRPSFQRPNVVRVIC